METDARTDAAFSRARALIKKIVDSPKLQEMLQRVCGDLNENFLKLSLDVATRWNSTWDMSDRALRLKRVSIIIDGPITRAPC